MKHQWLKPNLTCTELEKEFGCKVKSVTVGGIQTGVETELNELGEVIPIIQEGVEIELEGETPGMLKKLDNLLVGLIRVGT